MSKLLLTDERIINIIATTVLGDTAKDQYSAIPTAWADFTHSDVAYTPISNSRALPRILIEVQNQADVKFYQRLIDYARASSRQVNSDTLPIVIAIVIKRTSQDLLAFETPSSEMPFAKKLSSIGWARSCWIINAETISRHLEASPLHPFVAVAHCLIQQQPSLHNLMQQNDETVKMAYEIMRRELGGQIKDEERASRLLDDVCLNVKIDCRKIKAALQEPDQAPLARIQGAISIIDNTISYIEEVAHKQQQAISDYDFAESQKDDNGHIPWKSRFDHWQALGRFKSYKSFLSAQSAHHRLSKKRKQMEPSSSSNE